MVQPINIGSAFPDQGEIQANMLRAAQIRNALAEINIREQELKEKQALSAALANTDMSGDLSQIGRNLLRTSPATGAAILKIAEEQAERKRQQEAMRLFAGGATTPEAVPSAVKPEAGNSAPVGAFDLSKPMPELPKLFQAEQEGRLSDEGRGVLSAYRSQVSGAPAPAPTASAQGGFGAYFQHPNMGVRAMARQGQKMAELGLFKDVADLNAYMQKLAEFDARFAEAGLSREERAQNAMELQQQLLQNQLEVARITAGLRPPPQAQIVTTEGGEMRAVVPGTATTTPLTDDRGQPLKKGMTERPLPEKVKQTAREAKDLTTSLGQLSDSFKESYGGKGIYGIGAEASMEAASRGVPFTDKSAAEWWRNYRKQNELIERHEMFGASLTGGEKQAWQQATIHPGMEPAQIKRNLATRKRLAEVMLERRKQEEVASGLDPERVNALYGAGMERESAKPKRKRFNPATGAIEEY